MSKFNACEYSSSQYDWLNFSENMTTTKGEVELRELIAAWDFKRKGIPSKKIVGD